MTSLRPYGIRVRTPNPTPYVQVCKVADCLVLRTSLAIKRIAPLIVGNSQHSSASELLIQSRCAHRNLQAQGPSSCRHSYTICAKTQPCRLTVSRGGLILRFSKSLVQLRQPRWTAGGSSLGDHCDGSASSAGQRLAQWGAPFSDGCADLGS